MLFTAVGFGTRSAIEVSARDLSVLPLFLAAVFISFALDPVVAALHRRGLERHRATQSVFIGTTALAAGFIYGIFSVLGAEKQAGVSVANDSSCGKQRRTKVVRYSS